MQMQNDYNIALASQHKDNIKVERFMPSFSADAQPKPI